MLDFSSRRERVAARGWRTSRRRTCSTHHSIGRNRECDPDLRNCGFDVAFKCACFISYPHNAGKSVDKFVTRLKEELQDRFAQFVTDPIVTDHDFPTGANYHKAIAQKIRATTLRYRSVHGVGTASESVATSVLRRYSRYAQDASRRRITSVDVLCPPRVPALSRGLNARPVSVSVRPGPC
jgi:hypothetical protein